MKFASSVTSTNPRRDRLIYLSLVFVLLTFCGYELTVLVPALFAPKECEIYHQKDLHLDKEACRDLYLAPGLWTSNGSSISDNYWTPLDANCQHPPNLLQDIIDHKYLPFLRGRTVLVVGDSVDRYALDFACQAVTSFEAPPTVLDDFSQPYPNNSDERVLHMPRICRIHEYDLELIFFFHYGMHETEIWDAKPTFTSPGIMDNRIPILKTLFDAYPRKPNLILLASGLWDLESFVIDEAWSNMTWQLTLWETESHLWLTRAEQFVDMISEIFPQAPLFWRWMHYCQVSYGTWFVKDPTEGVDQTPRAPFHERRIYEINQLYSRLLQRRPRLNKFPFGEFLTGHIENFDDWIHPGAEAKILYSNMLLYYVSGLQSEPKVVS